MSVIKDHSQLSDKELEYQFENFKLKPRLFTHEAHLRLVYIHIKKYGVEKAEKNMIEQIRGYANHFKANMKFNLTITIASTRIINNYISKIQGCTFQSFIATYPRLKENFKEVITEYYDHNVFGDLEAKKEFIPPKLKPLPS